MEKPPKYVRMGSIALRLENNEKYYYRDAGDWSVEWRYKEGKLLSWCWGLGHPQLHRKELKEISKAEWEEDNKGYI
jgi:hypothetical protein